MANPIILNESYFNQDEKAAFASTLYNLSQLSWKQLRLQPHHGFGYELIARNSIRAGIRKHIIPNPS